MADDDRERLEPQLRTFSGTVDDGMLPAGRRVCNSAVVQAVEPAADRALGFSGVES